MKKKKYQNESVVMVRLKNLFPFLCEKKTGVKKKQTNKQLYGNGITIAIATDININQLGVAV